MTQHFSIPLMNAIGQMLHMDLARWNLLLCLLFFAVALLICLQGKTMDERLQSDKMGAVSAVLSAALMFWAIISLTGVTMFIYSNF